VVVEVVAAAAAEGTVTAKAAEEAASKFG